MKRTSTFPCQVSIFNSGIDEKDVYDETRCSKSLTVDYCDCFRQLVLLLLRQRGDVMDLVDWHVRSDLGCNLETELRKVFEWFAISRSMVCIQRESSSSIYFDFSSPLLHERCHALVIESSPMFLPQICSAGNHSYDPIRRSLTQQPRTCIKRLSVMVLSYLTSLWLHSAHPTEQIHAGREVCHCRCSVIGFKNRWMATRGDGF